MIKNSEPKKHSGEVGRFANLYASQLRDIYNVCWRILDNQIAVRDYKNTRRVADADVFEKESVLINKLKSSARAAVLPAAMPPAVVVNRLVKRLTPLLINNIENSRRPAKLKLADESRTMLLMSHAIGFVFHISNRMLFPGDAIIHRLKHPNRR